MTPVLIARSVVWVLVAALTIAALAAPSSVAGSCKIPDDNGVVVSLNIGMFTVSSGGESIDTSDFYAGLGISKAHAFASQGLALTALFLSLSAIVVYVVSFALSQRCSVTGMRISMCGLDTLCFILFLAAGVELIVVYHLAGDFGIKLSAFCDSGPGGPMLIVCSVMTIIALFPTLCCVASTDNTTAPQHPFNSLH
eukprot:gene11975-18484_t